MTIAAATAAEAACTRIHALLARGAPWDACDAFREAIELTHDDAALLYCGALAHARAGATQQAHALLDRSERMPGSGVALRVAVLSLRGRLLKDELHAGVRSRDRAALARRASHVYAKAWALQQDPYPGINAASLALLAGDGEQAAAMARDVRALIATERAPATAWDHATLGEAALLLGDDASACRHYRDADALGAGDGGSIASMRRQLRLLASVLPLAADLLAALRPTAVVAFTGHMIDEPGRADARFPPALVPAVEVAVRERIARMHQPVFYGSAACGADLIVIGEALAIGAEVNIVLPFDRIDFVRTSVASAGPQWLARFEAALAGATRVIDATSEAYLGDDVLFEHAARLVEGLAVLRANQLEVHPRLLCVIDEQSTGRVGGTASAAQRWRAAQGAPEVIDLAALREAHPVAIADAMPAAAAVRPAAEPAIAPHAAMRTLKTLLFADFAGYGRLGDRNAPAFQQAFWTAAASAISAAPVTPRFANTWGDGLYLVFDAAHDGAVFAMTLVDAMRRVDWRSLGLASANPVRICLHTGPAYCAFDPVIGRDNYFGSSVTLAARIEPVTPAGTVFASEACAATMAATWQRDFRLEYVGDVELAKHAGSTRMYRIASAGATHVG